MIALKGKKDNECDSEEKMKNVNKVFSDSKIQK